MIGYYFCVMSENEKINKSVFKRIQHYSYVELGNKNKNVINKS